AAGLVMIESEEEVQTLVEIALGGVGRGRHLAGVRAQPIEERLSPAIADDLPRDPARRDQRAARPSQPEPGEAGDGRGGSGFGSQSRSPLGPGGMEADPLPPGASELRPGTRAGLPAPDEVAPEATTWTAGHSPWGGRSLWDRP